MAVSAGQGFVKACLQESLVYKPILPVSISESFCKASRKGGSNDESQAKPNKSEKIGKIMVAASGFEPLTKGL